MSKKPIDKLELYLNENISEHLIEDVCTDAMKIFGANINLMRYVPALNDGLKPGERRILYAMYTNGLRDFNKVASIAGDALKYHPHGDGPIVETIVRLGQPWNNIMCLIEGYGNFGSSEGDPPASGRYIEAKLSKYAIDCFFSDFSKDVVTMTLNFDRKREEPIYLPSKYPNVLITGSFGIGYGLSSGIPFYNLTDVLTMTIELIKHPNRRDIVLIPDSPNGSDIIDEGQFEDICKFGIGKYKMRGRIDIDEKNHALIIKSTPYLTSWTNIKQVLLTLNKSIDLGIKSINIHSDEMNMNIQIIFKSEYNLQLQRELIYKKTEMEKSYSVDFGLMYQNEVKTYNLYEIILHWIEIRKDYKRRIINHEIVKLREREHILKILIRITENENIKNTMDIIKNSENQIEMEQRLIDAYDISTLQAKSIAHMSLSDFTKSSRKKYKHELKEVSELADTAEDIIISDSKINRLIIKELEEGIKTYGEPRRGEIVISSDTVPNTEHIVVITRNGYIKKLNTQDTNIDVGKFNDGDIPTSILNVNNLDDILIFTDMGYLHKIQVSQILNTSIDSGGESIRSYLNIKGDIIKCVPKSQLYDNDVVLSITKNGLIKKSSVSEYDIRGELKVNSIKKTDKVIDVRITNNKNDVFVYSENGFAIRFPISSISMTNRISIGVNAMVLDKNDYISGFDIIDATSKRILLITKRGYVKLISLKLFKSMKRNSTPLQIINIGSSDELLFVKAINGSEIVHAFLLNAGLFNLDLSNIADMPKLSKGIKAIPVRRGDSIIDILLE